MPYFKSLSLPGRRRRLNPRAANDFTLPLVIWQYILQFVAADDLYTILKCRSVCKTFMRLIDDFHVYSCIDMAGICGPWDIDICESSKVTRRRLFAKQCLEANNPEALFRQAFRTMKKSGNIPMATQYLQMACRGGTIFKGWYKWIDYHDIAYYVLCMLQIIRGNQEVRNKTLKDMVGRLDWRKSGWEVQYCRHEAHRWLDIGQPTHSDVLKHIPTDYSFLPERCQGCGEHSFHRPFLHNMWLVNSDRNMGETCDVCKCYIEASNFYYKLRNSASSFQHLLDWYAFIDDIPRI